MCNNHYAFFCPECGEVWCRLYNSDSPGASWHVHNAACFNCGLDSLTLAWYPELTKYYPVELLAREVLYQIEEYMKCQNLPTA